MAQEVIHALLSPSASKRWLACPGSVAANVDKPWEQSEHALLGTTAHALLEVCVRLDVDPEQYIGRILDDGLKETDEEMADTIGYALDYVRSYVANHPTAKVYAEHRVVIGPQIGTDEDTCFGYSDLILDDFPRELAVVDYKHGIGIPVSVTENTQLRLYAAGMRQMRGRYRWYRAVVVQPRVRGRKPVQEAPAITDAQLVKWLDTTVRPVVPIALGDDAPRVAGDHCRYCHASGRCPAQFELVQRAAKEEFLKNDPKAMSPAQFADALNTLATLELIGEAIKGRAIELVHAGTEIPGYAKAWTNARRIWADKLTEDKVVAQLAKLGVPPADAYEKKLLSPAKAEDALKKRKLWPSKKRGEDRPPSPLEPLIDYTEQNPTIAKTNG